MSVNISPVNFNKADFAGLSNPSDLFENHRFADLKGDATNLCQTTR